MCHRDELVSVFTMAAFAQFHVADIHPFDDGNGRMCRFVSNHILQSVLPLPIGMFRDRSTYIDALVQGRYSIPLRAHESLFKLLLDSTVKSYRSLLSHTNEPICDVLIIASLLETAREECHRLLTDEKDQEVALRWFEDAYRDDDDSSKGFNLSNDEKAILVWKVDLRRAIEAL